MDFDFSDDQEQLREAVHKWVGKAYPFERRRAASSAGGFDAAAWHELAELGLTALLAPESLGGLGLGPVEAMVTMEELGRGLVLEPLVQSLITSAVISAYGTSEVQQEWVPKIAAGTALIVMAYQERTARYQIDHCETKAVQVPGGYVINGVKSLVAAGDHAHGYLVNARVNSVMGLFLVERQSSGVTTRGYSTQDGARAAEMSMKNAPATLVCVNGLPALEHAVDIGIACTCAEAVGAMEQTLAITFEYLKTRKQFGVSIGSFQALRHRAADMKMQLELARSMSYYAALKLNAPTAERRAAMARAKYQLGVSMRFVGQQAIQLHGGIGVTDDYIVSHYFKKLTQLEMTFGDTLHQLGEVSARMQDSAGVFA